MVNSAARVGAEGKRMSKVTLDTTGLDHFRRQLQPEMERAVTETTAAVWAKMRQNVAVDQGDLQAGIEEYGSGLNQGVKTDQEYDYAQEFGRPDLPNYTYTPYARPAAEAERNRYKERAKAAIKRAIR